jgi:hypothetical protein
MAAYYASLLIRAFMEIPGSLGSNWLGLLWPVILVACGEIIACLWFGWRIVLAKWKQATGIGFAALGVCYTLLFAWCAFSLNYQEYAVLKAQSDCAQTVGKNITLEGQNRDQQSTINNCQTQALKLLAPEPLKMTLLTMSTAGSGTGEKTSMILLLTNRTITPVGLSFQCNRNIINGYASIVGSKTLMGSTNVVPNSNLMNIQIDSPAWSSISPILLVVSYAGPDLLCSFERR